MDVINIKNLEVFANHGVLHEETVLGQKFLISAAFFADLRNAGETDDITKTIDYGETCHIIKAFVEENTFCLIETLAERLAEKLLCDNPLMQELWLEIKKPWAPIALPLEAVSVELRRGRHTAYVSMGSNIGDRERHLRRAVDELGASKGCRVVNVSKLINTAPYGYAKQDDFLNGCLELETLLNLHELLDLLHCIEDKAGRVREVRWGPRTLDLDIVFYDDIVFSDSVLRIPHADMHNRDFVLTPLNEIAPFKLHPVLKKTVAELLGELRA